MSDSSDIRLLRKRLNSILTTYPDPNFIRRAQIIVPNLRANSAHRVLDAGCGFGSYEVILRALFNRLELVSIDIDAARLRKAKGVLLAGCQFVCSDAANLPFRDNSFDRVIASEVLEHIADDRKALADIARVLRSGRAFVSVPHANYPVAWDPLNFFLERLTGTHIPSQLGVLAGIWSAHRRLYSEVELVKKITDSGLTVVSVWRNMSFCLPFLYHILFTTAAILERLGFVRTNTLVVTPNRRRSLLRFTRGAINLLDRLNTDDSPRSRYLNLIVRADK